VGKHLKSLTKHPRQKIRAFAIDLIEIWKGIIIKETSKNKNGASDSKVESTNGESAKAGKLQKSPSVKVESTNGESAKAGKLQKSPSVKVEKGQSVKVEKTNGNGTSKLSSGNVKVQNTDVKTEKTDRTSSIKVEKIAKEEKPVSVAKKNS
ncbi:putative transcription elongation factor S-II, partial [Trifolium medium]|nr:putative transcription elongation factor S-II [Trifolium medium]